MIKKFIQSLFERAPAKTGRRSGKTGTGAPVRLSARQHGIDPALLSPNAVRVTRTLQEAGFKAYVVGGAVRDLLLGVRPKDFDIATDATPEDVVKHFRRARIIGRRFRLVHVMFGPETMEVSTFRANAPEEAQTDEHGRVLRDNVFGSQADDAARRDFTANALYYDPSTQTVLDYFNGVPDIKARILRIIGDPKLRYREDPVRMLRAMRFAAKLQFSIDETTRRPIAAMAPLIENVPAARLFDEMLKLLTSGHAMACLHQLRKEGLHHGLLPMLDVVLEQPQGERFITLVLDRTDARVRAGKPVAPSFLFAALLWNQVLEHWQAIRTAGEAVIPALFQAMDEVLERQTERLAIPRRLTADMREIWSLQPRFERRTGKSPYRMLEHLRYRAAWDFLSLRAEAGEIDTALADWWEAFANADGPDRTEFLSRVRPTDSDTGSGPKRRRRRSRGGAGKPAAETPSE
ncbi:MAG: polynucleotide adenylyltransferase PcnB [Burkholderiaceae bacterium]|nr:MAG: polynucleotide adenylyltransferase PcnB [Burkholderiaceae bacterium]